MMVNPGMEGFYTFVDRKLIIHLRDRVCESSEELLASDLFSEVLRRYLLHLNHLASPLLTPFASDDPVEKLTVEMVQAFKLLTKMPIAWAARLFDGSPSILAQPDALYWFVEGLYDFWREFERLIVCDSQGDVFDQRPYRTFNRTIESLSHLVRSAYRDIQENISGKHPNIYRQVRAGAEIAAIALPKPMPNPGGVYAKIAGIPIIRQLLLYPPLLLNPPMNKRTGSFTRIGRNPLELFEINPQEWLCYPARVGKLLILIYFHEIFYELGFSLCNLFELADDACLDQRADAIYLFGAPPGSLDQLTSLPTVFYEDTANRLLVGAVPGSQEYGYFGYLKKMVLTLHNVQVMNQGKLPFHGALVHLDFKDDGGAVVLLIGDTATGKSETLEAFRALGAENLREMTVIADDMGSLEIDASGQVLGYGTEIGAFVRLDDLSPGYAFGHLDRAIIMNPSQVNARVVLPVTTYEHVVQGYPLDMVLYANNYESVDDEHPVIEAFSDPGAAFAVFRRGTSMSKGTTTSTGLVQTYFANIFGPAQYPELHEGIAWRYFNAFYQQGLFVGQLRTRLGLPGWERKGPEEAAQELLRHFSKR